MTDLITVTIRSWGTKYNKRPDIKHPHWFALSNKILQDPEMYILNSREFTAWIYILSLASDKKSGTVTIIKSHADTHQHWFTFDELMSAIKKLGTLNILEAHFQDAYAIRTRSVRDPERSVRQTETEIETETETETEKNHIKDFENSFDQKSLEEMKSVLNVVFGENIPPDLLKARPKLLTAYGSVENFRLSLEEIWNSDKADPEKNPKWRSYVVVSVKKQAGLMRHAS